MPILSVMQTYFRGERIESLYLLVPYGLVCFAFAAVAVRAERNAFGWGIALPFVLLGLIGVGVGGSVGLRTNAQVAELTVKLEQSPEALLAVERPRMAQVNRNWPIYLGGYLLFIVLGAGLRFGLHADWAQGLGIGLLFFGASGLIIDGFAERRAKVYTEALESLAKERGLP